MFPKTIDIDLPRTIDEAVTILLADLPLMARTRLAKMTPEELDLFNHIVGLQIAKDFRLWSGNDALLQACMTATEATGDDDLEPSKVIVRAMWQKLQETHVLRLVQ
jgi:hypothetical protein